MNVLLHSAHLFTILTARCAGVSCIVVGWCWMLLYAVPFTIVLDWCWMVVVLDVARWCWMLLNVAGLC